jgi:hypothetical protein
MQRATPLCFYATWQLPVDSKETRLAGWLTSRRTHVELNHGRLLSRAFGVIEDDGYS